MSLSAVTSTSCWLAQSGREAELAAILCDDTGKATICLISPHTTLIKKRIEVTIPKKKQPGQGSDKSIEKFYKQIFESVLQFFNLTVLKLVIIASPGATKELVYESIFSEGGHHDGTKVCGRAHQKI
ncbi:hypothetical protein BY996DRAFT_6414462 [Phakopsora pachyrhizi]|nr:hypothetical protein BY996DRAFT_6414462 [Phakopsora pachyrhizi]